MDDLIPKHDQIDEDKSIMDFPSASAVGGYLEQDAPEGNEKERRNDFLRDVNDLSVVVSRLLKLFAVRYSTGSTYPSAGDYEKATTKMQKALQDHFKRVREASILNFAENDLRPFACQIRERQINEGVKEIVETIEEA